MRLLHPGFCQHIAIGFGIAIDDAEFQCVSYCHFSLPGKLFTTKNTKDTQKYFFIFVFFVSFVVSVVGNKNRLVLRIMFQRDHTLLATNAALLGAAERRFDVDT